MMLSFDQLVADRDALKAKGADTTLLDEAIIKHEAKIRETVKQFKDKQAQARG